MLADGAQLPAHLVQAPEAETPPPPPRWNRPVPPPAPEERRDDRSSLDRPSASDAYLRAYGIEAPTGVIARSTPPPPPPATLANPYNMCPADLAAAHVRAWTTPLAPAAPHSE